MTGRIFLNYRRADAEAWADRVFERLVRQFPRENVFMDIDGNIPFGFPWAKWLDDQVAACDLMLVLIGRTWVAEFQARADPDERDFVRVEIESALARRIPVVPVFLGDAPVPKSADLPPSVRPLLALQSARLQRLSFDSDAEVLVTGVARSIALARGEAVPAAVVQRPAPVAPPPKPEDRFRAEGRIRIEAPHSHGAPKSVDGAGWLLPGAGRTEWFRDLPDGPEMVVIPAGHFMMGSPDDEPGRVGKGHEHADIADFEEPRHRVTIAQPFAVGRCAVTVDEFAAFVTATGHMMPDEIFTYESDKWERRKGRTWRNPGFAQTGRHPVVGVSWDDAGAYAKWLSEATKRAYRLLSEAEWEYACRGGPSGEDTPFWWGKAITPSQANYDGNYVYAGGGDKGAYRKATLAVDYSGEKFEPNPWGLHQMHGNVWEWCADVWYNSYDGAPAAGTARDGADKTVSRVVRGGSWFYEPRFLRSAFRVRYLPVNRFNDLGFRLARTLPP